MKRILVIGDLHGKDIWKNFADINMLLKADKEAAGYGAFEPDYDYYVFLGDYVDAFDKDNMTIRTNLMNVINFKKLYPDNVILLWGNHDIQYYLDQPWIRGVNKHTCTGYRPDMHFDLYEIFNTNKDLFQLAFQIDNYLFTHAGVHKGWYRKFKIKFDELLIKTKLIGLDYDPKNLADKLNIAFDQRLDCIFDVGHMRGGYKNVGGPLWLDKKLGFKKPLKNFHQIVGHTAIKDVDKNIIDDNTTITYIDILEHKKTFYVINLED